jgi:hypothetical protein
MVKKETLQKKWTPEKLWTVQGIDRHQNEEEPGRQTMALGTEMLRSHHT